MTVEHLFLCELGHRGLSQYLYAMRERIRLDTLMVERGLFQSRTRAAAAVLAGEVSLGSDGARASKPGMLVARDVEVAVADRPRFVSRGGLKLERALECFEMPVEGRSCLDVGASTGGFTDCLLRRGAERVTCIDVGYGALDWRLREDPRVTVMERFNARNLQRAELAYAPDLIAMDLSFISLAKVLPAVAAATAPAFDLLALVKPQFELGRGRVGKGGVVRNADDRSEALVAAGEAARGAGLSIQAYCSSGLPGPAGNLESFMWCTEASRAGVEDLITAAGATELEVAAS